MSESGGTGAGENNTGEMTREERREKLGLGKPIYKAHTKSTPNRNTPKQKHVAIYCRVSTDDQTTLNQEADLQKWVEAYAANENVIWYTETGSGRTVKERVEWMRLEQEINVGRVKKLVVWKLDRLGRNVQKASKLFERLIKLEVPLISIRDGVDLSTSTGRLMANVIASFAQYEVEVMSERIKAALDRARKEGKRIGGSKKGRVTKKSPTPHQKAAIVSMKKSGASVYAISKALRVARRTVERVLESS